MTRHKKKSHLLPQRPRHVHVDRISLQPISILHRHLLQTRCPCVGLHDNHGPLCVDTIHVLHRRRRTHDRIVVRRLHDLFQHHCVCGMKFIENQDRVLPPLLLWPAVGSAKGKTWTCRCRLVHPSCLRRKQKFSPSFRPQQSPPPSYARWSRSRTGPCRRLRNLGGARALIGIHIREHGRRSKVTQGARKARQGLEAGKNSTRGKSKTWLNEPWHIMCVWPADDPTLLERCDLTHRKHCSTFHDSLHEWATCDTRMLHKSRQEQIRKQQRGDWKEKNKKEKDRREEDQIRGEKRELTGEKSEAEVKQERARKKPKNKKKQRIKAIREGNKPLHRWQRQKQTRGRQEREGVKRNKCGWKRKMKKIREINETGDKN